MSLLVVAAVAGGVALVVLLGSALVVTRRREARLRAAHRTAELQLAQARADLETLSVEVGRLSAELADVRRTARRLRETPEYVITSLVGEPSAGPGAQLMLPPPSPSRAHALEDQLVEVLAAQQDGSPFRARVVEVVVKTMALGHGVRRALSPDVLDRAAAEAHVARRRSRRNRKREEREAKRLLRAVRDQQRDQQRSQRAA